MDSSPPFGAGAAFGLDALPGVMTPVLHSRGNAAPLATLFGGCVADYLSGTRLSKGPCIFVHIPKTAGTSLRAELASILRPDANIHVDYTDASRSFAARLDDAVDRFLAQIGTRGYRFASGHIQARHVDAIARHQPDARFVTLLREPAARVVSDYRHQRSPKQPGFEAFRERVPTLGAFLDLQGEQNKMAVHLVPAPLLAKGDATACIDHVTRHFAFVGIQEMYDLSFRILTTLAGHPALPRRRDNVADAADGEGLISAEMAERIRALNPLDAALYDHFAGSLQLVRVRLEAALPPLA